MEYVIFALLVLNAVLLVVLLLQNSPSKRKQEQQACRPNSPTKFAGLPGISRM